MTTNQCLLGYSFEVCTYTKPELEACKYCIKFKLSAMTSKDALREFVIQWGQKGMYDKKLESDLTALISEGYISKEEHEKMKHVLTHCASCGEPLSRDCPRCKHLWET